MMGLCVGLTTKDGLTEHQKYSVDKWSGGREFMEIVNRLPHEELEIDFMEYVIRSLDFEACRQEVLAMSTNNDFFIGMLDVIQADLEWWIRPSY